ncbi:putative oxidoreductase [Zopfia rhizophila CBS 207.26]|uniref:Putative oxidoreductase n=1 Tax=Zopfia rhizophila CBS 207.26 TaxID=1314779 RepID=A0A6A6DMB0_9PEZI|nr:putative oxidoreductase [Zopfia rhizophila CBS 207.26]
MATTSNGIKLIYGAGGLSSALVGSLPAGVEFHDFAKQTLDTLEKEGISTLDSAEIYPGSEEEIGYHGATNRFNIDTKLPGGLAEPRRKDQIIAGGKASLERLKTKQVDVLYFHAPETTVPFEEQLSAANELYKQGAFKRLGISNFTAQQTQEVYDISKKNGWVLPTVYQGNYSAVARVSEEVLFPTLRKLGINFYAYSPIAGGFLAKTRQQIEGGDGRFNPSTTLGQLYGSLYKKSSLLDALDKWNEIASSAGISKAELAYRWVAYHSILSGEKGDGIIFGAHKLNQLTETIGYLRAGPLPAEIVVWINGLWEGIKHEAPQDNFHSVQ